MVIEMRVSVLLSQIENVVRNHFSTVDAILFAMGKTIPDMDHPVEKVVAFLLANSREDAEPDIICRCDGRLFPVVKHQFYTTCTTNSLFLEENYE